MIFSFIVDSLVRVTQQVFRLLSGSVRHFVRESPQNVDIRDPNMHLYPHAKSFFPSFTIPVLMTTQKFPSFLPETEAGV